ncbi:MAG TPA: TIGR04255 family protein [Trueperaceae bacterium]
MDNPLKAPVPEDIPLKFAPLIRVLAQVRFPLIASIQKREYIAAFQEAIRKDYPTLRQERTQELTLGPQGVVSTESSTIWRFTDRTGNWRVSVAPSFCAIESTKYSSRKDFISRLEVVLQAVEQHINPQLVDRIGLRYVDQLTDLKPADIQSLVRPEIAGILTTPVAESAQLYTNELRMEIPGGQAQMMARWALVPPGSSIDPGSVPPAPSISWVLDLDVFEESQEPFDVPELTTRAEAFAERIYTFFRWVVTDEFIERYGGGQ